MKSATDPGEASQALHRVQDNISRVIVGKRSAIRNTLLALAAGRHVLVEDVPGVGKTTLVRALALSLGCSFQRIQFTPDLLPSDVLGSSIYLADKGDFRFRPGPIFHQVILADEINRASPKTQSSLLEAMEEGQVTVDGVTHELPRPFLVLATQNPIEYEGTFPLPEAQLDRFALSIKLGYPEPEEESEMLTRLAGRNPMLDIEPVASAQDIVSLQKYSAEVHVSAAVKDYIVRLATATREHEAVYLGASPRASRDMMKVAQALALYQNSEFVLPDHVQEVAPVVLGHRLLLTPEASWSGRAAGSIIEEVLKRVPAPVPTVTN